jgi:hypothetical protein
MSSKNDFARLAKSASRPGLGTRDTRFPLRGASLVGTTAAYVRATKPGRSADLRSESVRGSLPALRSIGFGSPSSPRTAASSSGVDWGNLLQKTASGGLSAAAGGGLLDALGGIGGLISSIAGLFGGGKKALPPLTRFALPSSQSRTLYVGGADVGNSHLNGIGAGGGSGSPNALNNVPSGNQLSSEHIIQTVRQALLTSSSLNDVISEI